MGRKEELRARIDSNNRRIAQIIKDIEAMKESINDVNGFKANFREQKASVYAYDISVGGTWKQDLCDAAVEYKNKVFEGVQDAIDICDNTVVEIKVCIQNALDEIRRLREDNDRCAAEIRAIEEAEEAERRKNPECYRS